MSSLPTAISLVMRSYNEAWALEDTLKGVLNQNYTGEIELIVIDSGSTDGSHEIIRRYEPAHFTILEPGTYVPGKVLNAGMRAASHEWVVFLNSDATPHDADWLPELLKVAMETPRLGTAFSRQVPRSDCQAVFAHDYERCFGPERESAQWDHFFSMVSCVVFKAAWREEPFREDLQYAEDDEWSRRLRQAGYAVAFAEKSLAIHSHNYTPVQAYKRARGDALAVAKAGNVPRAHRTWLRDVLMRAVKDTLKDATYCKREGKLHELPHAFRVRYQQRRGRLDGYREGLEE